MEKRREKERKIKEQGNEKKKDEKRTEISTKKMQKDKLKILGVQIACHTVRVKKLFTFC